MMNLIRTRHGCWSFLALGAPALWGACVYDWTWPPAAACGPDAPCADNEYCVYPDHLCGEQQRGSCQPRPTNCIAGEGPAVCACDIATQPSPCAAAQAGLDFTAAERCDTKDPGMGVPCGFQFCAQAEGQLEMCRKIESTGELECVVPPCQAATCDCPDLCETGIPPWPYCDDDRPNGGLIVTCP